ncbi:MAG: hypothetical protein ACJAQT_000159 [Akkermansiaceae bacterium]|jgi:hypothetical protein
MCGYFSSESLWLFLPLWLIGSIIFLFSGKKLHRSSIFTVDWILSFILLSTMTFLLGHAISDILWAGHAPIFKHLTFTPLP